MAFAVTSDAFFLACCQWVVAPNRMPAGFDFRDAREKKIARIVMSDAVFAEIDPPVAIEFDSNEPGGSR